MRSKRSWLEWAGFILPLVLAVLCMFTLSRDNQQSSLPVPMPQSLIGEYSYDGENWFPLTDDADLSALKGDLRLRGHLEREIEKGQQLKYYRNHIGVAVYVNGELISMDVVAQMADMGRDIAASMCGRQWYSITSPGITAGDEVEFRLFNPHRLGNESAYRDFLTTLCGDMPGVNLLEKTLEPHGAPQRVIGGFCAVIALMILGAAVTAVIVRAPVGGKLFKQSMLTLFAGGFILFDTLDVSFWNEIIVVNTYGRQLSMMLAVFCAGHFVADALTGRKKRIVKIALGVSAAIDSALIIASIAGFTLIYDTLPLWGASQVVLCPLMAVCCGLELFEAKGEKLLIPATGLALFGSIIADAFGVAGSIVLRAPVVKIMFIALFIIHILEAVRGVVINHRATLHAAKLEKELENSRISIMLSQIQPHFLYNVLGTIRGLCREDPMRARQALGDFSDYLRCNMSALANSDKIHFSSELIHIEAYLRLEKMRMGGKLNILYDIQEKDFLLPPLTVQPLAENAVKHGLFEKDGGTLTLKTRREDGQIVITVQDDGIGFDENAPLRHDDRHAHLGLINVRKRLESISGGRLVIDSAPGRGTVATVYLPAENRTDGGKDSHEHTGH